MRTGTATAIGVIISSAGGADGKLSSSISGADGKFIISLAGADGILDSSLGCANGILACSNKNACSRAIYPRAVFWIWMAASRTRSSCSTFAFTLPVLFLKDLLFLSDLN